MEEIIVKPLEELDELQTQAQQLHYRIMNNGQLAASALFDFCLGLKEMRDQKLYIQLGYETFDNYAEQAVGIKQRQAYSYISSLEKLGKSVLQSNANIGITKLVLLSQVKPVELDEFVNDNNLVEMSTRELQEAVAKLNAAEEQISFLTSDNEELQNKLTTKDELDDLANSLAEENKLLKIELEEKSKTSIQPPNDKDNEIKINLAIEQAKKDTEKIHKKELAKIKKKQDDLIKAESKKAVEEATKKYNILLSEKQKSDLELENALKQAKVNNADPRLIEINFMFTGFQNDAKKIMSLISAYGVDNAEKAKQLKIVIANVLDGLKKGLEN